MCFEVLPLVPPGTSGETADEDEDDISPLDEDGADLKPGSCFTLRLLVLFFFIYRKLRMVKWYARDFLFFGWLWHTYLSSRQS